MPDRLRITYPVWVIYSFPILVEEQNDDFAAIAKGQAAFDDGSPPAQYLAVFMSAESAKDFAARHGLTTCSYKALAKDEFRPFLARAKKWGLDHVGAEKGTQLILGARLYEMSCVLLSDRPMIRSQIATTSPRGTTSAPAFAGPRRMTSPP